MTAAERAARRIAQRIIEIMRNRGLVFTDRNGLWDDVVKEDDIAAIITEERDDHCDNCGNKLFPGQYSILCHKPGCAPVERQKEGKL